MTIRRSIFLGIALLVGAAGSAGAADMYDGGSLKDGPYMMPEMARWYLRGDVGYATHRDSDMRELDFNGFSQPLTDTSIDEAWTIGGGIGVYFSHALRGDVTIDHRADAGVEAYKPAGDLNNGNREFDVDSTVVLANLYYDIDMRSGFTPYLGFGLGWASNRANEGAGDGWWGATAGGCGCGADLYPVVIESNTTSNFAWALMAGFTVDLGGHRGGGLKDVQDISSGLKLDFGYRYLDMGEVHTGEVVMQNPNGTQTSGDPIIDDYAAHEFRVGLRYDIY
ncbi:MAG: outer membrane beta-barrel protein [Hyphomicrobiaceae bacterium]